MEASRSSRYICPSGKIQYIQLVIELTTKSVFYGFLEIILRIWNLNWKHGWIFSVWKRSNLEVLSAIHNFEPDIKASSIFDQGHKEKKAKSTTLMQCMCSVRYVFI